MRNANRTAQCERCEGVLFKIKPSTGYVAYECVDCENERKWVKYDKYKTMMSTCEKCGGDTFKVRITVDEQDESQEFKQPECVKCKGSPKSVYVDNDGKLIDEREREFLITKDIIKSLEEEVNTQRETIEQLEEDVDNLNNEIQEKDNCIYDLESQVYTSKRLISRQEDTISELEWKIRNLE